MLTETEVETTRRKLEQYKLWQERERDARTQMEIRYSALASAVRYVLDTYIKDTTQFVVLRETLERAEYAASEFEFVRQRALDALLDKPVAEGESDVH